MTEAPAKTMLDLKKDDQAEIKTGEAMQALINIEGWKFYEKLLLHHLEAQRNKVELANPEQGESGDAYALRMERAKGTIIGLRLALGLPPTMIATAKDLRKRLLGSGSEE